MRNVLLAFTALCLVSPPGFADEISTASAEFVDTEGEAVGTATLVGTPEGVLIEMEVSGLPSDTWLSFHVHEEGECDHEDDFESAGEHFNPEDRTHGYFAEDGPHAGDMPNQYADQDGVIRAHVFNSFLTLGEGDTDVVGLSLVIHDGVDDYETDPDGDPGDRIACAVVE